VSPLEIYVLLKLDTLRTLFSVTGWLAASAAVMACIHASCMLIEEPAIEVARMRRFIKWMVACGLASLVCWALTPSSKDVAVMYVGSRLSNSELVRGDIPADAAELYRLGVAALKEKLTPDSQRASH
jgi:hypothetical protein